MEKILYDKNGETVAYIAEDYHRTIYLWDGEAAAYLFEECQVYGINGRHLGWFKEEVIYDQDGARVGFTSATCPVPVSKPLPKGEKSPRDEIKPRWAAPPLPKLSFKTAGQNFAEFLGEGRMSSLQERSEPQTP